MIRKLTTLLLCLIPTTISSLAQIPNNEIWYTTTDKCKISFSSLDDVASHTYVNGKGVIKFNNSVTEIGGYAFWDCRSLTSITIPATVTQIGDNVFAGGSPWLSITCLSTTPPQATTLGISEETTIYVPKKSVSAYKKAEGWTNYKKQIKRIKEQ